MVGKSWMLVSILVVAAAAGGCGGDDEVKAMPGTMNPQMARSSVQQAVMVRTAADSMNGGALASAVMALNASTTGMVGPSGPSTGALLSGVEQTAQAQTAGVTCTATSCKYDNFKAGGSTINGTVNMAADSGDLKRVTWDLTIKNDGVSGGTGGFSFDYAGAGDIKVSTSSLAGEVRTKTTISGTQNGQSFNGGTDAVARYTSVTISNGVPTGGSVYAKLTSFGQSGGQSAAQAYDGTFQFGN